MKFVLATLLSLTTAASALTVKQQAATPAPPPTLTTLGQDAPATNCPAQKTIPALLTAFDAQISGAGGRDVTCLAALFVPGGRLVPVYSLKQKTAAGIDSAIRPLTIEEYTERLHESRSAFYEKQTSYKLDQFGAVAQIFAQYEVRQTPDGPVTLRGVNSFHATFDGVQWHIVEVLWQPENKTTPMPAPFK